MEAPQNSYQFYIKEKKVISANSAVMTVISVLLEKGLLVPRCTTHLF